MCGISGFLDQKKLIKRPEVVLSQMVNALIHRGPDGNGIWFDEKTGVGLAHRRLSIIDLSLEGHQPMVSNSGRYVITFNGEVYNFKELRMDLEKLGHNFRGHSDTEIMLCSIEVWGLKKALSRFIGMFAFALWDKQKRRLYLVRDRLGIKPLYYGEINGTFQFASELKAFRANQEFMQPINRDAIALLLRHGYIPAPHCIYQGIQKLLPGHILTVKLQDDETISYQKEAYWSASLIVTLGANRLYDGTPDEAVNHLEKLLREAIALRMYSDVPLGTFLSGGIDSTVVTALMQEQCKQPVKTFSIGFHEKYYNEAEYAKTIAQHLGTDHTELYVSSKEAMAVIPKLPILFDEPFSDSSQIPTYLVSQLARQYVTVSLSGDGGDELFYGYSRYFFAQRVWKKMRWLPHGVRSVLGHIMGNPLLSRVNKFRILSELLPADSQDNFYNRITSVWNNPTDIVLGSIEPESALTNAIKKIQLIGLPQRMMFADLISYLPDDILVKVDRASMGTSLEARVPLLDHRIVEFAARLPLHYKLQNRQGKWILRKILYKYVPRNIVERPKMGFGVPINTWLCGPLRDWAEELLDERRLHIEGYFNPKPIREKWRDHINGDHKWQYQLWNIIMFQAWLENTKM